MATRDRLGEWPRRNGLDPVATVGGDTATQALLNSLLEEPDLAFAPRSTRLTKPHAISETTNAASAKASLQVVKRNESPQSPWMLLDANTIAPMLTPTVRIPRWLPADHSATREATSHHGDSLAPSALAGSEDVLEHRRQAAVGDRWIFGWLRGVRLVQGIAHGNHQLPE